MSFQVLGAGVEPVVVSIEVAQRLPIPAVDLSALGIPAGGSALFVLDPLPAAGLALLLFRDLLDHQIAHLLPPGNPRAPLQAGRLWDELTARAAELLARPRVPLGSDRCLPIPDHIFSLPAGGRFDLRRLRYGDHAALYLHRSRPTL